MNKILLLLLIVSSAFGADEPVWMPAYVKKANEHMAYINGLIAEHNRLESLIRIDRADAEMKRDWAAVERYDTKIGKLPNDWNSLCPQLNDAHIKVCEAYKKFIQSLDLSPATVGTPEQIERANVLIECLKTPRSLEDTFKDLSDGSVLAEYFQYRPGEMNKLEAKADEKAPVAKKTRKPMTAIVNGKTITEAP